MSGGATVRRARAEDAERVAEIGRASLRMQYAGLIDPAAVDATIAQTYSVDAVGDCIERCSRTPDAFFWVAEHAGDVVGYLHFDVLGPEPELHRLYVDSRRRGRGVGALLMEALHTHLEEPGYMLLVVAGNDRAIAFYERHGLRVEQHVDGLTYYRDRMGVAFPAGAAPFQLVLMRR